MRLQDFDFDLPPGQIAQHPAPERDRSRLLVLHRDSGAIEHRVFRDLPELLRPADLLVVNRTRVIPARLRGRRLPGSGRVELLLVRREGDAWMAMGKPGRGLRPGTELEIGEERLPCRVVAQTGDGRVLVDFAGRDTGDWLERLGEIPLPPYIRRPVDAEDRERYQTVYAREGGAVAAPTAGLHFTPAVLRRLAEARVEVAEVLLHVGPGTFEPVRSEDPRRHRLEPEYCEVDAAACERVKACRAADGRVVAVGTTAVRALEAAVDEAGSLAPLRGWSSLFIYPPFHFRAVDALVTNFHLPRSSLLLLVAALVGRELLLETYRDAVAAGYRFYSYGDAMLIL